MSQVKKNITKSLRVSEDAVAEVIVNTIKEIDGVYGVAPVKKNIRQMLMSEDGIGDISVGMVGDALSVTIGVLLEEGAKAVAVSETIQEKVKSSVQNMLGLTVVKVNVVVRGMRA